MGIHVLTCNYNVDYYQQSIIVEFGNFNNYIKVNKKLSDFSNIYFNIKKKRKKLNIFNCGCLHRSKYQNFFFW